MIKEPASPTKIAVLFDRVGPYHHARLRAAAKLGTIVSIELSGHDDQYAWCPVEAGNAYERQQLFSTRSVHTASTDSIRRRLRDVLQGSAADVVAIPGWAERGALIALQWCMDTDTPAIVMSDSWSGSKQRRWWLESLKRQIVGQFSAAIVAGAPQQRYIQSLGMPVERVFQSYDVVDNNHFSNVTRGADGGLRIRLQVPKKYFICVCRLVVEKNLRTLLVAYKAYRQANQRMAWDLVLVGDGPLRNDIADHVHSLGLNSSVHLKGHQSYANLPQFYGLATCAILPSVSETWGLAINEAMAAGLPVLVSNRCGCAEDLVREGQNGFTFDPRDVESMHASMAKISSGIHRVSSMGKRSEEIIEKWTPEKFGISLWTAARMAVRHGKTSKQSSCVARWMASVPIWVSANLESGMGWKRRA